MRGKPNYQWPPQLGLSILNSTEWRNLLPPPNTLETVAAFMGKTREGVRLEEQRLLRKLRIRMIERGIKWQHVMEAFHNQHNNFQARKKTQQISD